MTEGIVLLAFGKRGYGFAAWNLAVSIRHYNKEIPITLFHDDKVLSQVGDKSVFSDMRSLDPTLFYTDGRFEPANVKINMYDFLPYDLNLYLDVDSVALQDVGLILEEAKNKGGFFYTHTISTHNISQGRENPNMLWAFMDEVWEKYKLPLDAKFPATNSSFQFIKKCVEAEELFNQIKENFANRIPIPNLRMKWGGGQPDELYLNIALAQKNMYPDLEKEVMFFGNTLSKLECDALQEKYCLLSMYGVGGNRPAFTKLKYREWYDRLMRQYCNAIQKDHFFKSSYIMQDKHPNLSK